MRPKSTVLITGSSSALGLRLVARFALAQHKVVLHGRNLVRLNEVRDGLAQEYMVEFPYVVSDLSDSSSLMAVRDAITKYDVGIVINNAGMNPELAQAKKAMPAREVLEMMHVNALDKGIPHPAGWRQ